MEIDQTHARHAVVDHEHRGELSAAHDRRRWHGQHTSPQPGKTRLAEFTGSKAMRIGQRDLDEKRARIRIDRAADLITVPAIEVVAVPRKTGTASPFRIWAMRDSSARTSRRNPQVSSRRRRGVPGDAMFPGSTIFSVTIPSNGAAMVVKDSVVLAWSLAARALSTADAACNARADAPATCASALRSAAWRRRAPARWRTASPGDQRCDRGMRVRGLRRLRPPGARRRPPSTPVQRHGPLSAPPERRQRGRRRPTR